MWFTASVLAAPVLLGDPAWRAPDGIVDAAVAPDGTSWVRSAGGEVTGFDRRGVVLTTFQACPTRAGYLGTAMNPRGTRLAVDCGGRLRIFALPSGKPVVDIPLHAESFSFDFGETLGVIGRREIGDHIEDERHFLTYGSDGALRNEVLTKWDHPVFTATGWIGVIGLDEEYPESRPPLTLQSLGGPTLPRWEWTAPPELLGDEGAWRADNAVSVLDNRLICAAMDHGLVCLDSATGSVQREWSDTQVTLEPAGDGIRVGEALWFSRDGVLTSWAEGLPQALASGSGTRAPISNTSGSVRFIIETGRLVPVDGSGEPLPQSRTQWDVPVAVSASLDGSKLLVLDTERRVFLVDGTTGEGTPQGRADAIALSASGRRAWMRRERGSDLIDLQQKRHTSLAGVMAATFDDADTLYAAIPSENRLVSVSAGGAPETASALPTWVEDVGALDLRDQRALVYDEVGYLLPIALNAQTAGERISWDQLDRNDARLTPSQVTVVAETDDGDWRIGSTLIPGTEWVRVRPDGKGLITLSDDASHVHLRRNDGSIHKRVDLPGRFIDAWVFERLVVVALRDGRLVPIPLQ